MRDKEGWMDIEMPYIQYTLPNDVKCVLTSRPDAYDINDRIGDFLTKFKPVVRFQITDDIMKNDCVEHLRYHWFTWFAGRRLPVEMAYVGISIINEYVNKSEGETLWFHCDSSSMRAPTFLGLYLLCYKQDIDSIIANGTFNCSGKKRSCPKRYAETSMKLDPGINDLVENWIEGGEKRANNYINNMRN